MIFFGSVFDELAVFAIPIFQSKVKEKLQIARITSHIALMTNMNVKIVGIKYVMITTSIMKEVMSPSVVNTTAVI